MRRLIRKLTILTLCCVFLSRIGYAQTPLANFSATPVSGCSPLVVNFTDASTGSPTNWFWDFGNGATSTLKNPSTTYFLPNTYTVTLTVTNASGSNTKVQQQFVTVYGKPLVLFLGNDSIGCYPFPVKFTDISIPSAGTVNNSWIWDFGDGDQAATQNPQNTYLNTGNYTVSLKVTNDKGCFSTFTKPAYVRINGGVKADFSFVQPPVCRTPVTVNFSNASSGPGILSYQWLFGDGNVSAQASPSHTYTAPGIYSVTLITRSSSGCVDTLRRIDLFNFNNISTSFTAPDSVCIGEVVNVINTSSDSATSLWSFGNGKTSVSTSDTTSYAVAGTYTIRLLQSYGSCADSASKVIRVQPAPVASFTADKTNDCKIPATINFTSANPNATSYYWMFGDGTTSTQQNPSHTYTSFGNWEVTLVVTNGLGCRDTLRRPAYVKLLKPSVAIDSMPVEACIPHTVNFKPTIQISEPVVSYLWNLGNGVTSTSPTPSHTYTTSGSHTISLTVTTATGCTETVTIPDGVKVGTKPIANFTATPRDVCAFRQVLFTSTSTDATDYLWIFGDGGTSIARDPIYMYSDTGYFNVMLYVKNNGCLDSLKIDSFIKVKPPIAKFIYENTCLDKLTVKFTDKSIGALTWLWNFGDGTTSTLQNPVHNYQTYGSYTVTLTVTNDSCTHQMLQLIQMVNASPDFKADITQACKGSTINFSADTANSQNIVSYEWNFGHGGTVGNGLNVSTVYPRSGVYTVTLTITDVTGCRSVTTKPQYIRINGPTAGFSAINTNGCKGISASFSDSSRSDGISNIVNWQWNFGDGTIVNSPSSQTVQHVYAQPGSFSVSLIVTDAGGCSDTARRAALANITNIKAAFFSADTISCPGSAIRFINNSTAGSAFTSAWDFGNGLTSALAEPTTSYAADGLYSVKLKVTDIFGCVDSLTKPNYVSIKHPIASFTVSDSASACTPFQVHFTNTSTYYVSYSWDLGGGTSSLANPTQYYNQPGVYQTSLVVTSRGGCTDTATQTITVNDVSNAKINYLPLSGCKPLTVDVNSIAPKNMSYIWDFGDGTILNSNDTATQHVYNFFGDFVPKLILTDASGCVIPVTGPDTIRIKGATAKFDVDKRLLCDSGMVRFLDSTTFNNPIVSYEWNFGDGTISNQFTASHYYGQPGIYPVSVNVLTQNNCVDTFRMSVPVKVVASPDVRIDGDSVICIGEGLIHLGEFNRPDTSHVRWIWNFPNGKTSDLQHPATQIYTIAGDFVLQTIAKNTSGCTDTVRKNIFVNPLPWVTLPATLTTRTGTPVQIPASYHGGVISYNWDNAQSLSCSTCPEPIASPKLNTRYKVDFVDSNGCRNYGAVQVIVFCNNDNVFVPNTFSPNGDGSNDVFYVRGKGLNRVKSLRIFNRWGQVVFERVDFGVNDASAGWDGKFKGAKPIPDVYVYQMEVWCDNSTVVQFDGNVALIQ